MKPLRVDHLQIAHLKRAADPSFILIPQETLTIHTQVGPLLLSGQAASPTPRKRITIAHHSTISTWRDHHKSSSRAFAAVIRIFRTSPCRYRSPTTNDQIMFAFKKPRRAPFSTFSNQRITSGFPAVDWLRVPTIIFNFFFRASNVSISLDRRCRGNYMTLGEEEVCPFIKCACFAYANRIITLALTRRRRTPSLH